MGEQIIKWCNKKSINLFFFVILFVVEELFIAASRSIPVKCVYWKIFNKIVENQDLYRNKDDFWKFFIFNEKDIIFYKYICKMYILADIKLNCKKSRFIYKQRQLLKKFLFFYLKDSIFYKFVCKMYEGFTKIVTDRHTYIQTANWFIRSSAPKK